jgi:phosphotransferase system enzyme I (PtsI)
MRIEEVTGSAPHNAGAEQRLQGLAVSPGIAIGPAHIVEGGDLPVAENHVPQSEIEAERHRFTEAVALSLKQLRKVKAKAAGLPGSAAEEVGYLLDAHLAVNRWLREQKICRRQDRVPRRYPVYPVGGKPGT